MATATEEMTVTVEGKNGEQITLADAGEIITEIITNAISNDELTTARAERKSQLLDELYGQSEELEEAQRTWATANEEAKELKKVVEVHQARLNLLAHDLREVENGEWTPPKSDPQKTLPYAETTEDDSWRLANVDELNLPRALTMKLSEEGFHTLGEIEDGRATGKLRDLKGIGENKYSLIEESIIDYIAKFHRGPATETFEAPEELDQNAYAAGWKAFKAGDGPHNPHRAGTLLFESWSRGYSEAE